MDCRIFDDPRTQDRFTIVIGNQMFAADEDPFHPLGFGQYAGDLQPGTANLHHLGKEISYDDLPKATQSYVDQLLSNADEDDDSPAEEEKSLLAEPENAWQSKCIELLDLDDKDYEEQATIINDVLDFGSNNGSIGGLIYYEDTKELYRQYIDELNDIVHRLMNDTGLPINQLLKNYDDEDPLFANDFNQDLIVKMCFEETIYQLRERTNDE